MTDYPVLKNPPITEALLDFQVTLPVSTQVQALLAVQKPVIYRYPVATERNHWRINATIAGINEPGVTQSTVASGFVFTPHENHKDRAFQARLDGFTYSKLPPYEHWQSFNAEARELWGIYKEVARPIHVNRIGLRTINSISLPFPITEIKDYLLTTAELAAGIKGGLSQYFLQMTLPQPGGETVIITTVLQPILAGATTCTILFDIDAFVFEIFYPDSEAMWERCEQLRSIRNHIFFNSLTDKAKELFNGSNS